MPYTCLLTRVYLFHNWIQTMKNVKGKWKIFIFLSFNNLWKQMKMPIPLKIIQLHSLWFSEKFNYNSLLYFWKISFFSVHTWEGKYMQITIFELSLEGWEVKDVVHSRSEELLGTTAYSSFPPNLQCHVGLNWTVDTTPCWHSAHSVRLAYFSNPPSTHDMSLLANTSCTSHQPPSAQCGRVLSKDLLSVKIFS